MYASLGREGHVQHSPKGEAVQHSNKRLARQHLRDARHSALYRVVAGRLRSESRTLGVRQDVRRRPENWDLQDGWGSRYRLQRRLPSQAPVQICRKLWGNSKSVPHAGAALHAPDKSGTELSRPSVSVWGNFRAERGRRCGGRIRFGEYGRSKQSRRVRGAGWNYCPADHSQQR